MATGARYQNWITARWRDSLLEKAGQASSLEAEGILRSLKNSVIVEPQDILEGRVQFGSWVTVFGIEEEEEQSFQIVSFDESLSGPGLLDQAAPLAQALLGAREGDVIRVRLANGSNSDYEVTHIRIPAHSISQS